MLIIPAIDLKDGCVVRYVQGRKDKKIYSRSPLKTARHWIRQGAKLLHIVDLDGAFTGNPKNLKIVKEILEEIDVPIQFGGGVRSIETIKTLLGLGVGRVVLGTKAVLDKQFLKEARDKFNARIIVSVDIKDQEVLIKGWRSSYKARDVAGFCSILKDMGFKQLIYTDTLKDGTLSGPNIKGIKELLKETGLKLIASGGISSLDDIFRLKKLEKEGLQGIIVGKALYEGRFTLSEAVKLTASDAGLEVVGKKRRLVMANKILMFSLLVIFLISLSGCATGRKQKDLQIQGLKNQLSVLEAQIQTKDEEINSLKESLAKREAEETRETLSRKQGKKMVVLEVKSRPKVKQIQIALRNAGFEPGAIDGKTGKLTREAIKAFQKANNLAADGKVGKKTWSLLKEYLYKKLK